MRETVRLWEDKPSMDLFEKLFQYDGVWIIFVLLECRKR